MCLHGSRLKFCAAVLLLAIAQSELPRQQLVSAREPFRDSSIPEQILTPLQTIADDTREMISESQPPLLFGSLGPEPNAINIAPVYYGEIFSNTRGGFSTSDATRYQALLDLPVEVDLERLGVPVPGRFVLLGQNTHGRGLSEDFVGDFQTLSNIDSFDNIMQVSEYWWEFALWEDRLHVRLGKQDLNTEFLVIDLAQDFIHSSFGLSPTAGLPSYPDPSMAAVVLADLTPSTRLKVGIWDLLPNSSGWGFSDNTLTLVISELETKYRLAGGSLPGAVDLGLAYASPGEALGTTIPSIRGCYIQFEQLVFRENPSDADDTQGFGLFASWFPRTSQGPIPVTAISSDMTGGLVYEGLFPGRDMDVLGVGAAWARLNQGGTRQETAIEAFYKAQVTPSVSVTTDIQYLISPSGIYRNALVVGVRFQVAL